MPEPQATIPEKTGIRFIDSFFKQLYSTVEKSHFYRFPVDRAGKEFYDPFELGLFPHESLGISKSAYRPFNFYPDNKWGLYEMQVTGGTLKQMLLLDTPADQTTWYGTTPGEISMLSDFYVYIDFILEDQYPADTAGCFISYSNRKSNGIKNHTDIVITPGKDILKFVTKTDKKKSTTESFPISEKAGTLCNDEACPCSGNQIMKEGSLDIRFLKDAALRKTFYEKEGIPYTPQYARVEILRFGGISSIYINGELIKSFSDDIEGPVTFAAGPVLFNGGQTATCSIGSWMIYSKRKSQPEG